VFGEKSIEFPSSTVIVQTVRHPDATDSETQDQAALAGAAASRVAG